MLAKEFLQSQLINSSKFHMKEKASKSFKVFDNDIHITVDFKQQMKEKVYDIFKTVLVIEFCPP